MPPYLSGIEPEEDEDGINPKTFKNLHPVHYQIFEILKYEIPVTLLQTCRQVYLELVPKVYEKIEIGEDNYAEVIEGATFIDKGNEKPKLAGRDPAKWEVKPTSGKNQDDAGEDNWSLSFPRPLPGLKDRALFHTKLLCFSHSRGALEFVKDSGYCKYETSCETEHLLPTYTFPNVNNIHLGEEIMFDLAEMKVTSYLYDRESYHAPRLEDLFRNLWKHCQPTAICMEWPKDWDRDFWNETLSEEEDEHDHGNSDDDDEGGEDWATKKGMDDLIVEIVKFNSVEHITLHLDIQELPSAKFDLSTIVEHANFTFHIRVSEDMEAADVIDTLITHFRWSKKYQSLAFRYLLPNIDEFDEVLDQIEQDVIFSPKDKERFDSVREKIVVDDNVCQCQRNH